MFYLILQVVVVITLTLDVVLASVSDRLLLVSEHYTSNLQMHRDEVVTSDHLLRPFLFQLLQGLAFLHRSGLVHRNLDLNNILFDEKSQVKLADFGLFELTNYGSDVNFVVGHPLYLPPEIIFSSPQATQSLNANAKVDVWSVGILLLLLLRNELPYTDAEPAFVLEQYGLLFQRHARQLAVRDGLLPPCRLPSVYSASLPKPSYELCSLCN